MPIDPVRRGLSPEWRGYVADTDSSHIALPCDFLAVQEHFVDHLAAIWFALPESDRGSFYVNEKLLTHCAGIGIQAVGLHPVPKRKGMVMRDAICIPEGCAPVVVAASGDAERAAEWMRPIIMVEHGCGLSFSNCTQSHSGGNGARRFVNLFIMPNRYCGDRDAKRWPQAQVAVVGSPKMDKWHALGIPHKTGNVKPVVCYTTHWDCHTAPETRSAYSYFAQAVAELATAQEFTLAGHCHPRMRDTMRPIFANLGIPFIETFDEVCTTADLLIGDAGSAPYEFAYLDKPVVVCNAPWYRRNVSHGLRFWEHVPGLQCDDPAMLYKTVVRAIADPQEARDMRHAAVDAAYVPHDGNAAQRATQAILQWQSEAVAQIESNNERRRIRMDRYPRHPSSVIRAVANAES